MTERREDLLASLILFYIIGKGRQCVKLRIANEIHVRNNVPKFQKHTSRSSSDDDSCGIRRTMMVRMNASSERKVTDTAIEKYHTRSCK